MIYSIKEVKMKVDKFKSLIKESIKEVLLEEGFLKETISAAIKENTQHSEIDPATLAEIIKQTQNLQANLGQAQKIDKNFEKEIKENQERAQKNVQKMQELRDRMMDSIGKSSYKDLYNFEGVDLFEGTTPLSRAGVPNEGPSSQGPLSGVDPDDAGVSIDSLLGNKKLWEQLIKK